MRQRYGHAIGLIDQAYRRLTSPWRLLPRLLIIGAQKSGTTSLYQYLVQHQAVLQGRRKEVRYFSAHHASGAAWYRTNFPIAGPRYVTIDASTGYLPDPGAPERVAAELPEAKIVVLLRDPVERAWSHYRHSVREGHESLGFAEALRAEEARLEPYHEALRLGVEPGREYSFFSYLSRGRYAGQLQRWFADIDRDRFLVRTAEELYEDPRRTTNEVLAFLDLDPLDGADLTPRNVGSGGQAMPHAERERLEDYFEPHNAALYELLNWDMVWARSAA